MEDFFEIFDTTGDVGITIYGKTLEDIFEQAGYGLFSLITEFDKIECKQEKKIQLNAEAIEVLFINWLNELIFLFDTEGFLAKKISVNLKDCSITAKLSGETFDDEKHPRGVLIKAATYHKLRLEKKNGGWFAKVLFDI